MVGSFDLLHLEQTGVESRPVLFLHGLAASGQLFARRMGALGGQNRLLFVDLLGFGRSPRPHDSRYGPAEHVLALHRTLQVLAAPWLEQGLLIVGHSLGGRIALEYAAHYPQYVRGLLLFSPTVYASPGEAFDRLASGSRMANMILHHPHLARAACYTLCSTGLLGHAGPLVLRQFPADVVSDMARHSWPSLSRTLQNSMIESETGPLLRELKTGGLPVTIVAGQYDRLVGPEQIVALQAALPSARVESFPAGHHPFYREPDLCRTFLQQELIRLENTGYKR